MVNVDLEALEEEENRIINESSHPTKFRVVCVACNGNFADKIYFKCEVRYWVIGKIDLDWDIIFSTVGSAVLCQCGKRVGSRCIINGKEFYKFCKKNSKVQYY